MVLAEREMKRLEELARRADLHARIIDAHARQIRGIIRERNVIVAQLRGFEVRGKLAAN